MVLNCLFLTSFPVDQVLYKTVSHKVYYETDAFMVTFVTIGMANSSFRNECNKIHC